MPSKRLLNMPNLIKSNAGGVTRLKRKMCLPACDNITDQTYHGEGRGGDTAYVPCSSQEPRRKGKKEKKKKHPPGDVPPSAEPPAGANAGSEEEFVKDAGRT